MENELVQYGYKDESDDEFIPANPLAEDFTVGGNLQDTSSHKSVKAHMEDTDLHHTGDEIIGLINENANGATELSDDAPNAPAEEGSAGVSETASRADHAHPKQQNPLATTTSPGYMSPEDKGKIDKMWCQLSFVDNNKAYKLAFIRTETPAVFIKTPWWER
ncbi:hypothetical protein AGMMS49975_20840 [Clostridia bacterium]|nr:hypothetical protein AGMMS49975_20840 [Clostridia bacterium]